MSEIYKGGMTHERYRLISDPDFIGALTDAELAAGWHWCLSFDGMPVHETDEEMEYCCCFCKRCSCNPSEENKS